jgi:2,4-dienoyl-CoA reductase-like NADH-dependent reductase (Old Yellow Enzyme family)
MDEVDRYKTNSDGAMAPLFVPFRMKSLWLPNRIVMAPMTRASSPGGVPTDDMRAWYRRRAENGVGLIMTEGVKIPHLSAHDDENVPDFHGEKALAEWARIVGDVHSVGGKIMPQLWHVGLMLKPELDNFYADDGKEAAPQCGPSGMLGGMNVLPDKKAMPMSQVQIDEVIEAFAKSAEDAHRLGFDGVELHAAHGYLIDQFFWDKTNLREDCYGGSIAKRSTFAAEIVAAIRSRTSPDFPIVLRFSQWKLQDFGAKLANTPHELEEMLTPLVEAGVDMLDCSQRRYWEPEFEESPLNLAGWTRKVSGLPVITVGSVGLDIEMIDSLMGVESHATPIDGVVEMVGRGEVDMVGVARMLIANPDWPRIVEAGDWNKIKAYDPKMLETVY